MRVGVAGLGRMGGPMAANLARAAHAVTLWNRSPGKAAAVAAEIGAQVADSPRALAAGAEAVARPQGRLALKPLRAAASAGNGARDMASILQYVRGTTR